MSDNPCKYQVRSEEELEGLYSPPDEVTLDVTLNFLDGHFKQLLSQARFVCVATESNDGVDVTPRGGDRGFVQVIDDRTIAIPDWPGNNKISALRNIVRTGRVGTLFLFPGVNYFLRINGPAVLSRDPVLLERMATNGKLPKLAIVITTEEAYFHCGKAVMRSGLWKAESWPGKTDVPPSGKMLSDQLKIVSMTPEEITALEDKAYRNELY